MQIHIFDHWTATPTTRYYLVFVAGSDAKARAIHLCAEIYND
jgi:hypothetical protein